MLKTIIKVASVLFIISFIGGCLYFVGGVSATYAPIKIYDYAGSKDKFETGIRNLTNDHKYISYKITDTVGTREDGYAYYSNITLNRSSNRIEYGVKYEMIKDKLEIRLVEAIDLTNLKGGYSKKAAGLDPLLKEFNLEILNRLKEEQHIELKLNDSFWDNFSIY
jgi:hypothetical protein